MPMDSRILETTMSITRNGKNRMKPISKAVFSSLIIKAGINTVVGTSAILRGFFELGNGHEEGQIFLPGLSKHETPQGF